MDFTESPAPTWSPRTLMAVLGEVAIVIVRGEDWLAADEADQHQYELTSGERGVVLVKEGGNALGVLEVVREANPSRAIEAVSYDGGVGCSQQAMGACTPFDT